MTPTCLSIFWAGEAYSRRVAAMQIGGGLQSTAQCRRDVLDSPARRRAISNQAALTAVADIISAAAWALSERHAGGKFGSIDPLIPKQEKFVGEPRAAQ